MKLTFFWILISLVNMNEIGSMSYRSLLRNTIKYITEQTFRFNINKIREHNELYAKGNVSWQTRINQFASLSENRFRNILTYKPIQSTNRAHVPSIIDEIDAPESWDWTKEEKVSPIKNQRFCGSCWAFVACEAIESSYAIKYNKTLDLSEQYLVDCVPNSRGYYCDGCNGGIVPGAWRYIMEKGIATESEYYPYTAKIEKCNRKKTSKKIKGWMDFLPTEENMKKALIKYGPLAVSLNADGLQFYSSGIYDDPNCRTHNNNHYVLLVGYGNARGKDYWILKNSWGNNWGEKGFFKMSRGVNRCGITEEAFFPVVL